MAGERTRHCKTKMGEAGAVWYSKKCPKNLRTNCRSYAVRMSSIKAYVKFWYLLSQHNTTSGTFKTGVDVDACACVHH